MLRMILLESASGRIPNMIYDAIFHTFYCVRNPITSHYWLLFGSCFARILGKSFGQTDRADRLEIPRGIGGALLIAGFETGESKE